MPCRDGYSQSEPFICPSPRTGGLGEGGRDACALRKEKWQSALVLCIIDMQGKYSGRGALYVGPGSVIRSMDII
jgi:hypothetical protein